MSWQHRLDIGGGGFRRAAYVLLKRLLSGSGEQSMIRTDVANLLEAGPSINIGTVDRTGLPDVTRGWGTWVLHDPERVRVLVPALGARTLENVADHGPIALNATEVETHRSFQLKGRVTAVEPATRDDLALGVEYRRRFFAAVKETEAIDLELIERMVPETFVALEFEVDDVFDQTPGPTAGKRIA